MIAVYNTYGFSTYKKTIFADLTPLYWNFRVGRLDGDEQKKNAHRIFAWEKDGLFSYSFLDGKLYKDEFMYAHFLRREMKCLQRDSEEWLVVPNKIIPLNEPVTKETVLKYSKNRMFLYWLDFVRRKWRKVTPRKAYTYIRDRIKYVRAGAGK